MLKSILLRSVSATLLFAPLVAAAAAAPTLNTSGLIKVGDGVRYGSYVISKIGDGIYKINDPGDPAARGGGMGVDMYLIRGSRKALMIDLGNDYIDGFGPDLIAPRKNAAAELRAVVYGLTRHLPLEIAVTHAHPDHAGMTAAFAHRNVTMWMPAGEDLTELQQTVHVDTSVYASFVPGEKTFDLGRGRVVKTMLVKGHTDGSTVYLLAKDGMIFTGDAIGNGLGQQFRTVERLKTFTESSRNLVQYLSSTLAPYDRYTLRVYTGHTWQNAYGGIWDSHRELIDVGFLDWRFIQNVASCANDIIQGKWLVPGSGLVYVGKMPEGWSSAGLAIMVYGIGTIFTPLQTAYAAAGLPAPTEEGP